MFGFGGNEADSGGCLVYGSDGIPHEFTYPDADPITFNIGKASRQH